MRGDSPLLMKLSVNLTPHGTMILIPAYWSFDSKRDVRWAAVMKLHCVRAEKRQGPFSRNESADEGIVPCLHDPAGRNVSEL